MQMESDDNATLHDVARYNSIGKLNNDNTAAVMLAGDTTLG